MCQGLNKGMLPVKTNVPRVKQGHAPCINLCIKGKQGHAPCKNLCAKGKQGHAPCINLCAKGQARACSL